MASPSRSLVSRIVLSTATIYAVVTLTLLLLAATIVRSSFWELEEQLMLRDRERVLSTIVAQRQELTSLCIEWSAWDAVGEFLDKPNDAFIETNISPEWRKTVGLDVVVFVRRDGTVPWGTWIIDGELVDTAREDKGWAPGLGVLMPPIRKAMASLADRKCRDLLLPTNRGPLYLTQCPVIHSDYSGEPKGVTVFGRLLNAQRIESIAHATQTRLTLSEIGPKDFTEADLPIERSARQISIPVAFRYSSGGSGIVFRAHEDRRLWQMGMRTLLLLGITIALGGLAIAVALLFLIRGTVLSPIRTIARHMRRFIAHGDEGAPPVIARDDELGQLADDYGSLLRRIQDRSADLQRANDQLEALAHTDLLTGLPNRRMFDVQSSREVRRIRRDEKGASTNRAILGIVICDVDCFKLYNDTLGHAAGDVCLTRIARTLQSSLRRAGDLAFRFGGEEFVLLLPGCDTDGARKIAEMVRASIEALAIPHPSSPVAPVVTISLGGAVSAVTEPFSLEGLMERADRALYSAKAAGRNCVKVASGESPVGGPV